MDLKWILVIITHLVYRVRHISCLIVRRYQNLRHSINSLSFIETHFDFTECGRNYHKYSGLPVDLIIGGDDARTGAWPSMAILKYRGYNLCGATLVNIPGQKNQWLVTAAHCLGAIRMKAKAKIVLGAIQNTDVGDSYAIEKMIPHPKFKRSRNCRKEGPAFDIALIKVSSPVRMVEGKVEWACLPKRYEGKILSDKSQVEGLMCHAIGFGIYKEGQWEVVFSNLLAISGYRKHASTLQQLRVSEFSRCEEDYPACFTEHQICWGDRGRQSCVGDSGGPLLCLINHRWTVSGVSSRVMGRRCDEGSIYVNVADMHAWIMDAVKNG